MTFYPGQKVVTRSGKYGAVVEEREDGTVVVAFGSREFEMRVSQLVSANSYDRAGKGYARQQWQ